MRVKSGKQQVTPGLEARLLHRAEMVWFSPGEAVQQGEGPALRRCYRPTSLLANPRMQSFLFTKGLPPSPQPTHTAGIAHPLTLLGKR